MNKKSLKDLIINSIVCRNTRLKKIVSMYSREILLNEWSTIRDVEKDINISTIKKHIEVCFYCKSLLGVEKAKIKREKLLFLKETYEYLYPDNQAKRDKCLSEFVDSLKEKFIPNTFDELVMISKKEKIAQELIELIIAKSCSRKKIKALAAQSRPLPITLELNQYKELGIVYLQRNGEVKQIKCFQNIENPCEINLDLSGRNLIRFQDQKKNTPYQVSRSGKVVVDESDLKLFETDSIFGEIVYE